MRGMTIQRRMLAVVVVAAWCSLDLVTEAAGDSDEGGGGERANPVPHIVIILADDLGWNDVPWHNQEVLAPNLESLARGGVILNQSYVQPICTPSRSALLSGRYPFTIGRQESVIYPEEPVGLDLSLTLLPQALKAVGYDTHLVGKWHLGFCSWAHTPTERGFDTFYGHYVAQEDYYNHSRASFLNTTVKAPCNDQYCDLYDDEDKIRYLDFRNNTEPERDASGVYSTYLFASEVEKLLVGRDPEVPLFLYLSFQSVHTPLEVPEEYEQLYAHIQDEKRRVFFGMVSAMDVAVGRVVEALKDSGHYNNTVIVFSTDNGGPVNFGANNWPLRGSKWTLWEGGTRGAAFVHSPLLPNPGTTNSELMHITDWLPTLLGLAGGEVPEEIDGVDQWEALTGVAPSSRTHLVYNIDNTTVEFNAGIRLDNYKLLVGKHVGNWTPPPESIPAAPGNGGGGGDTAAAARKQRGTGLEMEKMKGEEQIVWVSDFVGNTRRILEDLVGRNVSAEVQLYDVEDDPEERNNVAAMYPEVVETMAQMLEEHMARYVPADIQPLSPASNPEYFDGVWSPGWC